MGKSIHLSLGFCNSFLHAGPSARPPNQSSSLGLSAQKVGVQLSKTQSWGEELVFWWYGIGRIDENHPLSRIVPTPKTFTKKFVFYENAILTCLSTASDLAWDSSPTPHSGAHSRKSQSVPLLLLIVKCAKAETALSFYCAFMSASTVSGTHGC